MGKLRGINVAFLVIVTGAVHSGLAVSSVPSAVPARLCFSGVYGEVVLPNGKLTEQPSSQVLFDAELHGALSLI
jgi:hypothetical protein